MVGSLPKTQLRKALEFVALNQTDLLKEFFKLNPTIKKI